MDELREAGVVLRYTSCLGVLAEGLGRTGQIAEGIATIDKALGISERYEERWCLAELLRVKGRLLQQVGAPGAAALAEVHFRRALAWAQQQGALSWGLRAAMSLARLWRDRSQTRKAHRLLASVYGRFSEGFETADLKAAEALIAQLR
jgi:predicted ATPase